MTTAPRPTVPLLILLSAVAAPLALAAPAHAAPVAEAGRSSLQLPAGDPSGAERVQLPSTTARAQRSAAPASTHWLLGTRGSATQARALARRLGGSYDATLGMVRVPTTRADRAADALGGSLRWAGPDAIATRYASFDSPGALPTPWAREAALAPSLTPPAGSLAAIGVVDDAVDRSVAELAGVDVINGVSPEEPHGTMVASTAAAPYDATGVVGVAPGARVLSWGTSLSCSDVANGVIQVVRRGARVVNLSLGFEQPCFALWQATSYAYAKGATVVAASGNDGDNGNPLSFPAAYPHVITAGAITPTYTVAAFSNYNDWVDIAAPGVDVPVDTPLAWDSDDGNRDGRTTVSGTSFASPYVAGGVSWLLGQRPKLDAGQVADVLRASTRDLETPGWDPYTGFGLLQVAPALAVPTPSPDPYEPNDDPAITRPAGSGTFAQPTVWTGKKSRTIVATGDSADDAVDAYRVKIPARGRLRATLTPSEGHVNLFAFNSSVSQFADRKPLTSSTRGATATDRITVRNRSSKAKSYFIVVNTVPKSSSRAQSRYVLKLTK